VFLASAFAIASSRSLSSFTAISPALASRLGIGSVAVPESGAGRSRDLNRYLPMNVIGGDLRRSLTFVDGVSGLRTAIGGDASDTVVAPRDRLRFLRAESPALPPLRQKRRAREPLVPSPLRVRSGLVTALRDHEPMRPPRGFVLLVSPPVAPSFGVTSALRCPPSRDR